VRQEVPDGDVPLPVALEAGDVGRHPVGQTDPALLHQHHHARRRSHDLGQGRQVENRVGGHGFGAGDLSPVAKGLLIEHAIAATYQHDGTRQLLLPDRLAHQRIDTVQAADIDRNRVFCPTLRPGRWNGRRRGKPGRLRSPRRLQDKGHDEQPGGQLVHDGSIRLSAEYCQPSALFWPVSA
jgi:hypothetical protein